MMSRISMPLLQRLRALGPILNAIGKISGTPAVSWGILQDGKVVCVENYGLRDVDAQLAPDEHTTYVVGSLTKAITAAMIAILVDEGKLDWTTKLQEVIPEFRRAEHDPAGNITIDDLLSHRSGLPSYDSYWLLSDNKIPIPRTDAIPILNSVPAAADPRTEFIYNNIAYEILGQIIEKVSGTDYYSFLKLRILEPLGMKQTFYTTLPVDWTNNAKGYTALANATAFPVPAPLHGDGVLMGPAGGIRSSVHDLLILYGAFLDAAKSQIDEREAAVPRNPLKQLRHLFRSMISLPLSTVREVSYAPGWLRVQLPASIGLVCDPGVERLELGCGLPSRLGLFHQGTIPGFTSFVAIFPETSDAVVVLTNSLGLVDTPRLVGQLLIEALFNNTEISEARYVEYARSDARRCVASMGEIRNSLLRQRTVQTPCNPLEIYVGTYENSIRNFFIEIRDVAGCLRIHFMGLESEGFDLEPYQYNSFFWFMSYDEAAKRARYTDNPKELYVIEFGQSSKKRGAK